MSSSRNPSSVNAVVRIFVDYNLYLRADEIAVPLRMSQVRNLSVGDAIVVEGDDGIPGRTATVLSVDGRYVRLRFGRSLRVAA